MIKSILLRILNFTINVNHSLLSTSFEQRLTTNCISTQKLARNKPMEKNISKLTYNTAMNI